ncbi:MAG: tRNA (N6-isopentenyl adenosine(37)-C2)-methylthiotransferase MiaB [Defluviitaleaceae bacterium]|nr:tRNA (N6-isopentenyl adenosine(37)-C2)-methylthiotransferase MiaB [Defluviitaleaceae bacterium]
MSKREEAINPSVKEVEIQREYIRKVGEINKGKGLKHHTVTYGCQMNAHDSEKIIGMLNEMGYSATESIEEADLIIYNTCCIRENAENRIYGNLGFIKGLKAKNKNLKVILCGCMMQQDAVIEKIKASYNVVDIIFGTYNLYRLPQLLHTNIESKSQIIDVWKEQRDIVEDLPQERKYKFKASVNIMYGCNNFCTYCIVPYVRGRERSREVADIIREVKNLVADGVKEITLLGQNVNSYGKTLEPEVTFAELLRMISDVSGLKRIRFMTSHPKDFSDELIEVIKERENICKSIHLPVQSGSSIILDKMNRFYDRDKYLELVEKLRAAVSDISITTDIIVGFPGETEEDNEATIDIIKKVRFSTAFTFIYSKRDGTEAARMEDQIEEQIAKHRFNKVVETLNPIIYELNKAHIGGVYGVLVESVSKNDENVLSGRLDDNSIVHFEGSKDLIGEIVDVKIVDCKTFYLKGELA